MQHEQKPEHGRADVGQDLHHDKKITITVNGRVKKVEHDELTFEQIVTLAFGDNPPTGQDICFTVTYRRGGGRDPEGTLVKGRSVKVTDGTIINVTATDKS